jgi:4-hydroxysphinganine ceramide fatty acyl 2-hydroxylase
VDVDRVRPSPRPISSRQVGPDPIANNELRADYIARYLPDNRVGITAHFILHGIHHYLPMDKLRLVMPPTLSGVLTMPFWKLAHTVFYWDRFAATAAFCGGLFGYVCYDLTHYFLHHRK